MTAEATTTSGGRADRGFVYRTLRVMEGEGLVASSWDPPHNGPARRTYRVTPAGYAWAASASATLREADRHMARYRVMVRGAGLRSLPGVPAAS